jgi:hypothetical protein
VATPDRSSRLLPGQKPWNPWHLTEYSERALRRALAAYFDPVAIQKMGGRPDVLAIELRRTRRLRWLLLPLTLPIVPEPLRVAGLGLVRRLGQRLAPSLAPRARAAPNERPPADAFGFGPEQLSISDHEAPSVNLIAIGRR